MTTKADRKTPDRSPGANLDSAVAQLRQARVKFIGAGNEAKADKVKAMIEGIDTLKEERSSSMSAVIKNGTEVTFTRNGKQLVGTLERKTKPDGIGRGKYPRAIVKVGDKCVAVPFKSISVKQ